MARRAASGFILLACAAAHGAEEPQWFTDARARESSLTRPEAISSRDGWFKARTPGRLVGAIELEEGSYSVELALAEDISVNCEVFPESLDLANTLDYALGNTLDAIEEEQGRVESRILEATDAGAFGPVPWISLSWLYRVATPEGPRVGGLRQFVMEKGEAGAYCMLNEIGFQRSFDAIVRALAESLETRQPAAAPYFVEIHTVSTAGSKVGVAISTLERDSDGDTMARQMTAILVDTPGGVRTQDSTHMNWLRPDGTLINAVHVEVENGELAHDLGLARLEGRWIVDGELQGEEVFAALPDGAGPGNWVNQARQLRVLMAEPDAPGREHAMGMWMEEDPAGLTTVTTKLLARQGDQHFTAQADAGGVSYKLTLDRATGTPSSAEASAGSLTLNLQRVYVGGSF